MTLYNNAGCSLDLSSSVMDRALFHIDNCYRRVSDVPCVNLPRSQAATHVVVGCGTSSDVNPCTENGKAT